MHNTPQHAHRVELVRRYLLNPAGWPDGLDLPNWKQPHEIWYTRNEQYWNALARAKQAELDKGISDIKKPIASPVNTVTKTVYTRANKPPVNSLQAAPVNNPVNTAVNSTDRKTYMRDYMRQRRAQATEKPAHAIKTPQSTLTPASS